MDEEVKDELRVNMVKPINAHYVYLGRKIKQFYLSYAFCHCGQYLAHTNNKRCPSCNSIIDWSNTPYIKTFNDFK